MALNWSKANAHVEDAKLDRIAINLGVEGDRGRGRLTVSEEIMKRLGWVVGTRVDIGVDVEGERLVLKEGQTAKFTKNHQGGRTRLLVVPTRVAQQYPKKLRKFIAPCKYEVQKDRLVIYLKEKK